MNAGLPTMSTVTTAVSQGMPLANNAPGMAMAAGGGQAQQHPASSMALLNRQIQQQQQQQQASSVSMAMPGTQVLTSQPMAAMSQQQQQQQSMMVNPQVGTGQNMPQPMTDDPQAPQVAVVRPSGQPPPGRAAAGAAMAPPDGSLPTPGSQPPTGQPGQEDDSPDDREQRTANLVSRCVVS